MDKRPQHAGPGGAQAQVLLSGDIHRRLGKGARDRYTTSYRQYTDVAKMVQVADGARQAFWTLVRSLKAVT